MTNYEHIVESQRKIEKILHLESEKENGKLAGSFKALRNSGRAIANQMKDLYAIHEEHVADYKKKYRDDYLKGKVQESLDKTKSACALLTDEYRKEVNAFIKSQKESLEKTISAPPTAEQLQLLQALQFEGKHITENEINAILPQLLGNYRAVKALEGIATNAGYTLAYLPQYDYETLVEGLEWTEAYLRNRCHDLDIMDNGKIANAIGRLFFGDYEDSEYKAHAIDLFDTNAQVKGIVTTGKRALTDTEKSLLDNMFNVDPRELKTTVRKAVESPEIRTLVELSPDYAPFLTDGE